MPWLARSLVGERKAFVQAIETDREFFTRVCLRFGISRVTGYKWIERYRKGGGLPISLEDQSRRPHNVNRTGEKACEEVLRMRSDTGWGATRIAEALKARGTAIGHTTVNSILKKHGQTRQEIRGVNLWINRIFAADDPIPILQADLVGADLPRDLLFRLKQGRLRDRKKAMTIIASLKGISAATIGTTLSVNARTVAKYRELYRTGGCSALFRPRPSRVHDEGHREAVFAVLHSPPLDSGVNRASWKMADLQRVLRERGHRLSETRIRRIIKAAGYKWRKARVVLTSRDPQYTEKVNALQAILADLKSDEAFFSIDEYGPFAVKKKPGRKLVRQGDEYLIPQWQKSKGWMIITAALELSRNQVTHFYSMRKNTDEMIRMANLLRSQYKACSRIYLSWDAASWHMSKKLESHLKKCNACAKDDHAPWIDVASLPAGAQFLNVIESVFSGMSRAIIHNSDYPSLTAARNAIDQYYVDRNRHFMENPKRAGGKIWRKERVPSEFREGQNCKDPRYG